jgi:hypothetical protein
MPPRGLNALSNQIDYLHELFMVLVEEQMELVKRRSGNLPVMLFVQIAKRKSAGKRLIEHLDNTFRLLKPACKSFRELPQLGVRRSDRALGPCLHQTPLRRRRPFR